MNPDLILLAAPDVMREQGRAIGDYSDKQGHVCALGAMAVVAGFRPDHWESLDGNFPHWLEPGEPELIEAARMLADAIGAQVDPDAPPCDLVTAIGDWHDGTLTDDLTYRQSPADEMVYDAFTAALLERSGSAA